MLSDEFDLVAISTNPEAFDDRTHETFRFVGGSFPNSKVGGFRALRDFVRENDPAAIMQIGDVPVYGNSIAMTVGADMKFFCRFSGDLYQEYRLESGSRRAKLFLIKNILGRIPLRVADHVITMGPRMKRDLVNRGRDPEDVTILPPPIDESRFDRTSVPEEISSLPEGPIALFVGRVSRLKGAETLETAIPKVLYEKPNFQFVLIGGVEHELSLPDEFDDNVHVLGPVPPSKVPDFMTAADVYVHPSLTEGVSRSVLEALACDTPVIVRDVGDLASVTSNIFTTTDEFIRLILRHNSLPVESAERFTVSKLRDRYVTMFKREIR
ncbi:glycosyl transferase group 1 protein [Halorubrum californiense DSM 19288]|uniref:Glycosyl transferase group 1 protein n=1 Tax=Halorubrum californiense DSM 19288 TaxID=1227465 RepID=M0E0L8_9EURY|nr:MULTISPECIES: glycosyltransferase family 4 protein [Halorubrum]ELZ40563.1 glycosyl transferase group 1 protein [Halorubrum californiense DSM 19288]TKX72848.1 glycosyltransferase [Halorubrum sp. GN11GM_10-3_MGM]